MINGYLDNGVSLSNTQIRVTLVDEPSTKSINIPLKGMPNQSDSKSPHQMSVTLVPPQIGQVITTITFSHIPLHNISGLISYP